MAIVHDSETRFRCVVREVSDRRIPGRLHRTRDWLISIFCYPAEERRRPDRFCRLRIRWSRRFVWFERCFAGISALWKFCMRCCISTAPFFFQSFFFTFVSFYFSFFWQKILLMVRDIYISAWVRGFRLTVWCLRSSWESGKIKIIHDTEVVKLLRDSTPLGKQENEEKAARRRYADKERGQCQLASTSAATPAASLWAKVFLAAVATMT